MTDFNGHPQNVTPAIKRFIRRANRFGLYVTSTTDGTGHTPSSYHYRKPGRAVDLAGSLENMLRFQRHITRDLDACRRFSEVFGPDNNRCVKNGARLSLQEGTALENQHDNHVHIAI